MVTNTDLYWRYDEANEYAQEPALGDEYQARFAEIEEKLGKLWWRDTAEWVAEFYREKYRAWKHGDRDAPVCRCPNPRCPLKQGSVPYQLRRRETTLDTPTRTPMDVLKSYLKTHSGAVVIDEALQELRDLRAEVSDDLVEYNKNARAELEDLGIGTNSVPMAENVTDPADIPEPPSGH